MGGREGDDAGEHAGVEPRGEAPANPEPDPNPDPNPNQAFVDSILSADEDPAAVNWLGLGLG